MTAAGRGSEFPERTGAGAAVESKVVPHFHARRADGEREGGRGT